MQLLSVLQKVLDKHGIKDSALQILLLAEIKATQELILSMAGNEEAFRSNQRTLGKSQGEILVKLLDEIYGSQIVDEMNDLLR